MSSGRLKITTLFFSGSVQRDKIYFYCFFVPIVHPSQLRSSMRHHFLYMGLTMQTHILLHQSHNFPRRHIHIFSNAHFQLLLQITHTVRYATSDGGDWWGLGGGRVGVGGVGTFSGHTRPINRLILWQTEVSRKSRFLLLLLIGKLLTVCFVSSTSALTRMLQTLVKIKVHLTFECVYK